MKYYLILALILFFGCISPDIFGQDVLKVQVSTEAEGPKDILMVNDIETLPRSPVLPDQDVRLFFVIENRDDTKDAENVKVDLFNPSSFCVIGSESCIGQSSKDCVRDLGGTCYYEIPDTTPDNELEGLFIRAPEGDASCNGKYCYISSDNVPQSSGGKISIGTILPGEQRQVQIDLKSPSEERIAGVKLDTDLHFSTTYDFKSTSTMEVIIVNINEILLRQRQGQSITLERNNIAGSGPLEIQGEVKGVPYILAGQPQGGIFIIKILNKGDKSKGDLVNGIIPVGKLKIEFPAEIGQIGFPDESCQEQTGLVCTNKEEIKLFKGESNPIRFDIINSPRISEPFRTHSIRASVSYTYELRNSVHVTVNPLQNVG